MSPLEQMKADLPTVKAVAKELGVRPISVAHCAVIRLKGEDGSIPPLCDVIAWMMENPEVYNVPLEDR